MIPTVSQARSYSTDHLVDAATHWDDLADRWEFTYGGVHAESQGLPWEGLGAEALHERIGSDYRTAKGAAENLRDAAKIARLEASNLDAMHRRLLYTLEDAQQAGFTVGEDWSVTDAHANHNITGQGGRQAQAQTFVASLRSQAGELLAHDTEVSGNMTDAAAGVSKIQAVDNTIHTHPHDDPFNEHIDPPPYKAPAGKEWHWYTGATGWKLEDPLKQCSGGDEFWYTAEFIGGIIGTVFYGPLGMIAVGHAAHDITHCAPPGG